ncbi:right-handed parallel beta-helix repeat-containing protein [Deinococcus aestuarii]|uniref:right-handed parallel beta-helix repeat-containing protein n=1 Tax=Deinococcus aestuarii TaxID=2774531 RepID=UPI001C0D48BD
MLAFTTLALMVGCGTTPPPAIQPSAGLQLEAEAGTVVADVLAPQANVETGSITNGYVFDDAAASGGKAMMLHSTNSAVRFTVPTSFTAGTYTVRVRGRGVNYNGNPIVALRSGGTGIGTQELSSASYSTYTFGNYVLKPGDVLDVVFTNDAYGGSSATDRNAVVDYLMIDPVTSATTTPSTPTTTPTTAPTTPTTTVPAGAVDVRTFGAKGDGVTDDTAALQKAAGSKKSLLFPAGRYLIGAQITFSDLNGVTVAGQGATILAKSTMPDTAALLMFVNPVNVRVSGLSVTGKNTGDGLSTPWQDGIWISGGSDTTVENNTVSRVAGTAIRVEKATRTTVQGNTVFAVGAHGIWGNESTTQKYLNNTVTGLLTSSTARTTQGIGIMGTLGEGYVIEGNTIKNIANTATKTEGASNVVYRKNTVTGYRRDGIKIMPLQDRGFYVPTVSNGVIEGNTVSGFTGAPDVCGSGLKLGSVLGGAIRGNTYIGTFGQVQPPCGFEDGITLEPYMGAAVPNNITIENNVVDNAYDGVRLNTTSTVLRGNRVTRSGRLALVFNNNTTGTQVLSNVFDGSNGIVALLASGVRNTLFQGNTFAGGDAGVYSEASSNTGNSFLGNAFGSLKDPITHLNAGYICSGNTGTNVASKCR